MIAMRRAIARIPWSLVALRVILAPALIIGERVGVSGSVLVAIATAAFLSDVCDGIIARRLGVDTDALRHADSVADTVFYIGAIAAVLHRAPHALAAVAIPLAAILVLEAVRWTVERAKFGRIAAYHMWSAKVWGIALWLGLAEALLTARAGPVLVAAMVLGIVADLEGLAATLVLEAWTRDLPSVWHAVRHARAASD